MRCLVSATARYQLTRMNSRTSIAALRFGYGLRPGEPPLGTRAMLNGVTREANQAAAVPSSLPGRAAAFNRYAALAQPAGGRQRAGQREAALAALRQRFSDDRERRLMTAVISRQGFSERLVWFWADHFSIAARGLRAQALVPAFEADAIRPNIAGRFGGLLRAAIEHPALLEYFGQVSSVGPSSRIGRARGAGLNENLAREVLELHTLGAGADYDQTDVRQFAELLTGLSVDRATGGMVFRPWTAEPGPEIVLGKRYGMTRTSAVAIGDALDDLAVHPATAHHIARKLAVHFVADDPDRDLVAQMEETFRATDGDLSAVYAAMLDHPASWRELGAKVRQPFDYVVASLRAVLPPKAHDLHALQDTPAARPTDAVARMNQPIWLPPAPNGWPEAPEAWITPPGFIARLDWASRLGASVAHRIDPRPFVRTALGGVARKRTRFAAGAAAERWEGIALVLASPEFNRR